MKNPYQNTCQLRPVHFLRRNLHYDQVGRAKVVQRAAVSQCARHSNKVEGENHVNGSIDAEETFGKIHLFMVFKNALS